MEELSLSIIQYNDQLSMVKQALENMQDGNERDSLLALQSELEELIKLTQENLDAQKTKQNEINTNKSIAVDQSTNSELDNEYALFMQEMEQSGAYNNEQKDALKSSKESNDDKDGDSDIEEELSSLLGMKCAVYHTHKWGGQPSLHNAMVSSVVPRQDDDQFSDLQVCVLYTHPTHAEMLPCPFYLNGECKFSEELCRYSHGTIVKLSDLKEAIEPNYEGIKPGSRILMKLKPPDSEDINTAKKSTEKYHLWHRAVVLHIDEEKRSCVARLEHGVKTGEKRKSTQDEYHLLFEEIFPLHSENSEDSDSEESLSDTEYPEFKMTRTEPEGDDHNLLIEKSLQNNTPAMGQWERHTRGIGSKLMLAMGYVPGTGLGAAGAGRLQPVEARVMPRGRSLDQCLALAENNADPLKVEQRLKRLQKREEERNKRAYEREKERERRNVFNFINKTLGDKTEPEPSTAPSVDIKQSTSKDLNIEQFKIAEDSKRVKQEIVKLNNSLVKYPPGTNGHKNINMQIIEKNKELNQLIHKEQQITKEQKHRKDKQKMTIF